MDSLIKKNKNTEENYDNQSKASDNTIQPKKKLKKNPDFIWDSNSNSENDILKEKNNHLLTLKCLGDCTKYNLKIYNNIKKPYVDYYLVNFLNPFILNGNFTKRIMAFLREKDESVFINKYTIKRVLEELTDLNNEDFLLKNNVSFPLDNSVKKNDLKNLAKNDGIQKPVNNNESSGTSIFLIFNLENLYNDKKKPNLMNSVLSEEKITCSINGQVHKTTLLKKDIYLNLSSKEILKSINNRLNKYKTFYLENISKNKKIKIRKKFFTEIQNFEGIGIGFSVNEKEYSIDTIKNICSELNSESSKKNGKIISIEKLYFSIDISEFINNHKENMEDNLSNFSLTISQNITGESTSSIENNNSEKNKGTLTENINNNKIMIKKNWRNYEMNKKYIFFQQKNKYDDSSLIGFPNNNSIENQSYYNNYNYVYHINSIQEYNNNKYIDYCNNIQEYNNIENQLIYNGYLTKMSDINSYEGGCIYESKYPYYNQGNYGKNSIECNYNYKEQNPNISMNIGGNLNNCSYSCQTNEKLNKYKSIIIQDNDKYAIKLFNSFQDKYGCISNYTIFKKLILIQKKKKKKFFKTYTERYTLKDYFGAFKKISIFGLEMPYISKGGTKKSLIFNPSLSSIVLTIRISNPNELENFSKNPLITFLNNRLKENKDNVIHFKENLFFNGDKFEITSFTDDKIKIEFNEDLPFFKRETIDEKFTKIKNFLGIKNLSLKEIILDESYLCILWNPSNTYKLESSILAYYSFDFKLIGISSKNFEEFWFTSFSTIKDYYNDYQLEYIKDKEEVRNFLKQIKSKEDICKNIENSEYFYINGF